MSSNCSAQERKLQGSFLIQFQQCTLKLDNEEYDNSVYEAQPQSFIPTTGLKVTPVKLINRLPLELLQEQHLEHRDNIAHLNLTSNNIHWKVNLFGWLSFGSFSTLMIIIIIAIIIGVLRTAIWRGIQTSASQQSAHAKQQPEEGKSSEASTDVTSTRYPRLIPQP
ncbi:AAEL011305-PA [Aedes aegypti]|uniref:AAEL011305-PA n=1 Tax=Aedes aegypti TaxID=7159 RepID=Q16QF8_AEDAE|nr:AAEL011305-PA [Aedes aegypti]